MENMRLGMLFHIGTRMWGMQHDKEVFNIGFFEEMMQRCAEKGILDIYLDIGEGIRYSSHPEIAREEALTISQAKDMLRRMRSMNLHPIPKLNFSTTHDCWMGDWARMVSSKPYYAFCHDMISETADIFDGPDYIHVGLDEETYSNQLGREYICVRSGNLWWSDVNFYMDEAKKAGCRPMSWAGMYRNHPEDCVKNVSKDMIFMPMYYGALHPEHYVPLAFTPAEIAWYAQPRYAGMNIRHFEEDPDRQIEINVLTALPKAGYDCIFTLSNYYNDASPEDVVEYCTKNVDSHALGFITAPWQMTVPEQRERIESSIDTLARARDRYLK